MGACDVIRHVTGYPAAPNLHWGIKFRVDSHYIVRYNRNTSQLRVCEFQEHYRRQILAIFSPFLAQLFLAILSFSLLYLSFSLFSLHVADVVTVGLLKLKTNNRRSVHT